MEKREDDITATDQMKILGYMTNARWRHDTLINRVISECSNVLIRASKCKQYMNKFSMKLLMEAQVLS